MNVPILTGRRGLPMPAASRRAASFEPETLALLARMSVTPGAARVRAYDRFYRDIKRAGLRWAFDCVYLMAAHDEQAARLNLFDTRYTASSINAPVFTVDRGFQRSSTTSYLDTGFGTQAPDGRYARDSAHLGVWAMTDEAGSNDDAGNSTALVRVRSAAGLTFAARLNSTTTDFASASIPSVLGLTLVSRVDSGTMTVYKDAGAVQTFARSSSPPVADTLWILRGTVGGSSPRQIGAMHAGIGLSPEQVAGLHAALATYMNSVAPG